MPLTNFGVIPGGAVGTELQAMNRRAVMPAVTVQIGKSTVLLSSMLAAAEPVAGGVSPVTIPVQGTRMVQGAWADYSGKFSAPQVLAGLQNAEYNLAAFVVGIPYYLFEGFVQLDAELVNILWARMNDAGNYTSDQLATALAAALSANTTLMPFSLNDIIATTNPAQGNVGNIDRTVSTWWQANSSTITALGTGTTTVTRANVLAAVQWAQQQAGGEPPTCGFCAPGFWAALAGDTLGAESYLVDREGTYAEATEGATVAFPAINIGGIPIYADLYLKNASQTQIWFPNFNYLNAKIHQEAAFAVAGPESLLPQYQLGYIMALFVLLSFVTSKSSAQSTVTGYTGNYTF